MQTGAQTTKNLRKFQSTQIKNRKAANAALWQVNRTPTEFREQFLAGNYDKAQAKLSEAIDRGEPWVLRAFLEAVGAVGTQHVQIAISTFLFEQLGASSADEARELIEAGRKMEALKSDASTSLEQYRNDAVDVLKVLLGKRPEWRAEVIKELGG